MKNIVLTRTSCVESRFGWTYVGHEDTRDGIATTFVDQAGVNHVIRSKYLVACDGGGSRVRKAAGIKMIGGPMLVSFTVQRRLTSVYPCSKQFKAVSTTPRPFQIARARARARRQTLLAWVSHPRRVSDRSRRARYLHGAFHGRPAPPGSRRPV